MSFASVFELISMYLQFMGITMSIRVNLSDDSDWDGYIGFIKLFQLNFEDIGALGPGLTYTSLPINESRLNYLFKTAFLPLFIAFVSLFLYKPMSTAVWFLILLLGVMCTIIGGFLNQEFPNINYVQYLVPFGAAAILSMLAIYGYSRLQAFLTKRQHKRRLKQDPNYKSHHKIEDIDNFDEIDKDVEALKKSAFKMFRMFLFGVVSLVIYVYLLVKIDPSTSSPQIQILRSYLIFVAGIVALLALGNFFGSQSTKGRRIFTKLNSIVRKHSLKVILIFLALMYIPITTVLFKFLICTSVSCERGQRINRLDSGSDLASVSSTATLPRPIGTLTKSCEVCNLDSQCPSSLVNQFCGGAVEQLLTIDPTLSCDKEIFPYFLPGTILLLVVFSLGIPFLYYRLIKLVDQFLEKIKVVESVQDEWLVKSHASKNSCSQMYNSYKSKWKYFKLTLMWYRLLIVSFFVFLTTLEMTIPAAILLFVVHVFAFVFAVYSRSYNNKSNQYLFYAIISMNILACSILLATINGSTVFYNFAFPFEIMNVAVPVLGFVIGYVVDRQNRNKINRVGIDNTPAVKKTAEIPKSLKEAPQLSLAKQLAPDDNAKLNLNRKPSRTAALPILTANRNGNTNYQPVKSSHLSSQIVPSKSDAHDDKKVKSRLRLVAKEDQDKIRTMDMILDRKILSFVVNYFVVLAVVSSFALSFGTIAIFSQKSFNSTSKDTRSESHADRVDAINGFFGSNEFGDYHSWQAFNDNCCCMVSKSNETSGLEFWECQNNSKFKTKVIFSFI